jgi:hypothetical protein
MTDRAIGVIHEDRRVDWRSLRALLLFPSIFALSCEP